MKVEYFEDSYGRYRVVTHSSKRVISPLISVIMSVYNGEIVMKDAIESILNQSIDDFEFVIVNDGSKDGTGKILEKYLAMDYRIVLLHQDNLGLTKSLNRALDLASGQFIARQDADDISLFNRFGLQLELLKRHKLDLIANRAFKNNKVVPNKILLNNVNLQTLLFGNVFIHGTFFFRADIIKKIKYDDNFKYSQDIELVCRMLNLKYRIGYSLTPIYYLTVTPHSISSKYSGEQNAMFKSAVARYCNTSQLINMAINLNNYMLLNFLRILFSLINMNSKLKRNSVLITK